MQSICLAFMSFLLGTAGALAGAGTHNAGLRGDRSHGHLHLVAEAQPEIVAQTLARVEDAWEGQVTKFVECKGTKGSSAECSFAEQSFTKSCVTVAKAIIFASNGEKDTVTDYMNEICNQKEMHGRKVDRCQGLAKTIVNDMTADAYDNRENLKPAGLCYGFWSALTAEEGAEAAKPEQQKQKDEVLRLDAEKAEPEAVRAEESKRQRITAAENAEVERRRKAAARLAIEQAAAAQKAKVAAEKRAMKRRKKEAERQQREAARRGAAAQAAAQTSRPKAMATLKEAGTQDELAEDDLQEATMETKELPRPRLVPAAVADGSIAQASPAAKATANTKGVPRKKLASVAAAEESIPLANPVAKVSQKIEHVLLHYSQDSPF